MIQVLGGGPAGAIAALAALQDGIPVTIAERSRFPRHKVCGEFISPEIVPLLDRLGLWSGFESLRPATVRSMSLHFGRREKREPLPEPAFGLSRYALDNMLWNSAIASGAIHSAAPRIPSIIACGRATSGAPRGARLFGFKAHFDGPADDAVELFFFRGFYVGINCVEGGRTNVCGIGPEEALRALRFDADVLVNDYAPLRERLAPLQRTMKWLFTGPLEFGQRWRRTASFYAGDALSFVDPFTGSGILCAARTGELAGKCAARNEAIEDYIAAARGALQRPFLFSAVLRRLASASWAERLVEYIPGQWLFRATRPR